MTYKNIIYEKQGRVARLTLDRPEKMSAPSRDLLDEYAAALIGAERDEEIRVIIAKGAGCAFSAGYACHPASHT